MEMLKNREREKTVLVGSDVPAYAEAIVGLLRNIRGIFPVLADRGCEGLFAAVEEHSDADVVLECGGLIDWGRIAELCREVAPRCVVVLTRQAPPEMLVQAREAGVHTVIDLRAPSAEVAESIRKALWGEVSLPESNEALVPGARPIRLTPREGQLVALLVQGLKNKEIAAQLGLSEGTIKVYLSKLFQKVGAKDRFELALFGLRNLANGEFGCMEPGRSRRQVVSAPTPARRGLRTLLVASEHLRGWTPKRVAAG